MLPFSIGTAQPGHFRQPNPAMCSSAWLLLLRTTFGRWAEHMARWLCIGTGNSVDHYYQNCATLPLSGELYGVTAISPTEVWAVGDAGSGTSGTSLTIRYYRWCPMPILCTPGWNVIDGPNPGPDLTSCLRWTPSSASDIWAVGAFDSGEIPMSQHWNGSYWSYVPMNGLPGPTQTGRRESDFTK